MAESAAELLPARLTLPRLREAASGCTACPLYRNATQTVFGEGPKGADVVLVGEQPGDQEDRRGHPFVGPAGRLLHEAIHEAGLSPDRIYETNVVKHFKWKRTVTASGAAGKRRLHEKPNAYEVGACRPWLDAELDVVSPAALVCLGSTAAQALLGRGFKVTEQRGRLLDSELAPVVVATVHPSSVLRSRDDASRRAARRDFVADLAVVARAIA